MSGREEARPAGKQEERRERNERVTRSTDVGKREQRRILEWLSSVVKPEDRVELVAGSGPAAVTELPGKPPDYRASMGHGHAVVPACSSASATMSDLASTEIFLSIKLIYGPVYCCATRRRDDGALSNYYVCKNRRRQMPIENYGDDINAGAFPYRCSFIGGVYRLVFRAKRILARRDSSTSSDATIGSDKGAPAG